MSFLVLLLALWVEKFSALRHQVQRDGFFLGELVRLERSGKVHPWWTLAILVLAPVALLVLLLHVLDPVAYGLLALPVHFVCQPGAMQHPAWHWHCPSQSGCGALRGCAKSPAPRGDCAHGLRQCRCWQPAGTRHSRPRPCVPG